MALWLGCRVASQSFAYNLCLGVQWREVLWLNSGSPFGVFYKKTLREILFFCKCQVEEIIQVLFSRPTSAMWVQIIGVGQGGKVCEDIIPCHLQSSYEQDCRFCRSKDTRLWGKFWRHVALQGGSWEDKLPNTVAPEMPTVSTLSQFGSGSPLSCSLTYPDSPLAAMTK